MLARIGDAMARERAFVADAGHELRTPLAILRAELDLALAEGRSPDELRAALASAAEETDRLTQLSEDLLTIAQTEGGRLPLRLEQLRLVDVFEPVERRFSRRAAEAGRAIEVGDGGELELRGDLLRLDQAVGTLVDNALRYGAGTIALSRPARRRRGRDPRHRRRAGLPARLPRPRLRALHPRPRRPRRRQRPRPRDRRHRRRRPRREPPTPPTAPRAAPTSGSSSRSHLTLIRAPEDRHHDAPDLLPPGADPRPHPGHRRALPGLEPRPRRDHPQPLRLEHPPERRLLPRLPRRHPLRHRARPLLLLPAGLGADLPRLRPLGPRRAASPPATTTRASPGS